MSKQPRCWLFLLLLLLLLLILYYIFTNTTFSTTVEWANQVCTTKECAVAAATLHQNMNEKVNPCDDFTEFVCGNYKLHHNLRDDDRWVAAGQLMARTLDNKLKLLLEAPPSPSEKPWHTLAKTYYQKCLDSRTNETAGRTAILGLLDEIGGWPMINQQWKPFNTSWEEYIASIYQKYYTQIYFAWTLEEALSNSSDWTLELKPFLLMTPESLKDLSQFLGDKNEKLFAKFDAFHHAVVEKFTNLLMLSQKSDETKTGPLKLIKQVVPNFDLDGFVRRLFKGIHTVSPDMTISIHFPEYFNQLHTVMTDKLDVANFVGLMVALNLRSQPAMFNQPAKVDQKQCLKYTVHKFGVPIAQVYDKNYFDRDAVAPKMKEMFLLTKESLRDMLNSAKWLDDFTRQNAIKKLDAMRVIIGYPDGLFNETNMKKHWNMSLPTPTEHFYSYAARINQKKIADALGLLNGSPEGFKLSVNAEYKPQKNRIIFWAPILEHPFYQPNVPDYVNYAGIGFTVAHEMMHAFDDKFRQFDENGNMKNWWTNETTTHYNEKMQCFIDQYNNHGIDGLLTLGENTADNIGIKLAYDTYKKLRSDSIEPALPGFEKYTVDQMFFILATSKWCDIMKPGLIVNDPHPRPIMRAMITMKNSKEYADAFKCSKTDRMNSEKKCTLW